MGGMAEILLGRLSGPSGFERAVVIKRILPHFAQHPSFVQMFLDEGRLAARIGHPNVVQVHELGQEGADLFLVMEYLQGESLAGVQRRLRVRGLRLDPAMAAHVVAAAAAGLHAAHELQDEQGLPLELVHRDVSPQNIFVSYDGTVKVLDFGVAKVANRVSQTEVGVLKGKLEYMSPEQARGEPVDRRSDIFGLGVVLYELLVDRRLFKRSTNVATWRAVCDEPIRPPRELAPAIPAELERICLKAVTRDPAQRYASALALRRELFDWLQASAVAMPEETLAASMSAWFSERISDKGRVFRGLRQGEHPSEVPAGEVDVAVELLSVVDPLESATPTAALQAPAPLRRFARPALLVLLSFLALLSFFAAGLAALKEAPSPTAALPPSSAPVAPAVVQAAPTVWVAIETEPPGARVYVDDVARGDTPLSLTFDPSPQRRTLRLERSGYVSREEPLMTDVSQRLLFSLETVKKVPPRLNRAAVPRPAPTPVEPPPVKVEPQFRRFE